MPDAENGPHKITAKNVKNGSIDLIGARRTTREAFDELLTAKSKPKIGDVLLTKDGTLGRTAVVKTNDICINQSVAVLTPKEDVLPDYLQEILSCRVNQEAMIADAGGTTIKHLYITRVPKIPVFVPRVAEQQELLTQLRKFQLQARECTAAYKTKLQDLDDLRQSLLQKAFAGELT
jgi:type I restriction enzyme S subunit